MPDKIQCPRCGLSVFPKNMPRHRATCDDLPPPAEMLAAFYDSGMSVFRFARDRFGLSEGGNVWRRLILAGATPEELRAIGKEVARRESRSLVRCDRCARKISGGYLLLHKVACDKHPPGKKLAAQWRESGLRVGIFCQVNGYSLDHVSAVLLAHGIPKTEQQDGGAAVRALAATPRCKRCHIVTGKGIGAIDGVCEFCIDEAARRKVDAPMLVR